MSTSTKNTLASNQLTLLLFYANDTSLEEIKSVEKYVKEYIPGVDVLKINVRTNDSVSKSFDIDPNVMPLVLLLENGREISRHTNTFSGHEIGKLLMEKINHP